MFVPASQRPSSPSKRERIVYGMRHSHCVKLPVPRTIRVHSWLQSQHGIASDAEYVVGSCARVVVVVFDGADVSQSSVGHACAEGLRA